MYTAKAHFWFELNNSNVSNDKQERSLNSYAAAPERKLEIQLHGGTLKLSSQRIEDGDVDLRSVESAVTRVHLHKVGCS